MIALFSSRSKSQHSTLINQGLKDDGSGSSIGNIGWRQDTIVSYMIPKMLQLHEGFPWRRLSPSYVCDPTTFQERRSLLPDSIILCQISTLGRLQINLTKVQLTCARMGPAPRIIRALIWSRLPNLHITRPFSFAQMVFFSDQTSQVIIARLSAKRVGIDHEPIAKLGGAV